MVIIIITTSNSVKQYTFFAKPTTHTAPQKPLSSNTDLRSQRLLRKMQLACCSKREDDDDDARSTCIQPVANAQTHKHGQKNRTRRQSGRQTGREDAAAHSQPLQCRLQCARQQHLIIMAAEGFLNCNQTVTMLAVTCLVWASRRAAILLHCSRCK